MNVLKRPLSLLLSLILIFSVFTVAPFTVVSAETAKGESDLAPVGDGETITIYAINNVSWGSCYVYYWGGGTDGPSFPGLAMTKFNKKGTKVFTADIPAAATGILFTNGYNGDANETVDVTSGIVDGKIWKIENGYGSKKAANFASTYYLVGTMNGWSNSDDYAFSISSSGEGELEYKISGIELSKDAEIKVHSSSDAWYPGSENYKVTETGTYTIYFRPEGNGGGDWHYQYFYVKNVTPRTVIWEDWDHTEIKRETVPNGGTPSYTDPDPARLYDEDYHYSFNGWSPTPAAVTADATYTAQYTPTAHTFTDSWGEWSIGDSSATVTITCDCGETHVSQAAITDEITTEASYAAPGERTYTASLTYKGATYTDTKTEPIDQMAMPYVEADGTERSRVCSVLTGSETTLSGWYAVYNNVTLTGPVEILDDVTLILCDGKTLTLGGSSSEIISGTGDLTIYGQSAGTGKITTTASNKKLFNITGDIVFNGGMIDPNVFSNGLSVEASDNITVNAGSVKNCSIIAGGKAAVSGGKLISVPGVTCNEFSFSAGEVTVTGSISATAGSTLAWSTLSDTISAGSYSGEVTLANVFTDGTDIHAAGVVSDNSALAGKTLIGCEPFVKHSLTLLDDIGVNFFLSLPSATAAGTVVNFVCDGNASSYTITASDYDSSLGLYRASCNVAATQMTAEITATVSLYGTTFTNTYTVEEYALTILNDNDFKTDYITDEVNAGRDGNARYAALSELVKSMLTYGAAAQQNFGVHTDKLADRSITYSYTPVTASQLSDYALTSGSGEYTKLFSTDMSAYGIEYYGVSLTLESFTQYNVFYWNMGYVPMTVTASFDSQVQTLERNVVDSVNNPPGNGDFVRYDICGIPAAKLRNDINLTFTPDNGSLSAKTFTVNPTSYIYEALAVADEYGADYPELMTLKEVMTSIYEYSLRAEDYFG